MTEEKKAVLVRPSKRDAYARKIYQRLTSLQEGGPMPGLR